MTASRKGGICYRLCSPAEIRIRVGVGGGVGPNYDKVLGRFLSALRGQESVLRVNADEVAQKHNAFFTHP